MLSVPAAAQFGAALLAMALASAATDASASTTPGVGPNYTFPDGSKGFAFMTTGGRLNPEVLVDFNPQPEPPGFGGSRDITPGGGRVTQIATPLSDTGYGFLIALLDVGPDAMAPLPPAPDSKGDTGAVFMADGSVFRLTLNFAGPGNAIDWAAFNPQPEPPGIWFGAQFGYPAAGDPVVTFALTENERPLTLSLAPVPEASAWALMIIGIGGVGALARSRTQTATAGVGRPTSYSRL